MNILIWIVGAVIGLYTLGYGITLYKLGNKLGGIAAGALALITSLTPIIIIQLFR